MGVEKKILKEIMHFHLYGHTLAQNTAPGTFTIYFFLNIQMLYAKFVQVVLEEKMLTHDPRRMTTDANP